MSGLGIASGQMYRIINGKATTSCIDISDDGERIIGNAFHDEGSQHWLFEDTGAGWTLKSVGTGKYLGREAVGDNVAAVPTDERCTWDIWPDEEAWYMYRFFVHGTKYNLDLANHGNATPGTLVSTWSRWHGKNQVWSLQQV